MLQQFFYNNILIKNVFNYSIIKKKYFLIVLSGLLTGLSYNPKISFGWLMWVSLTPLFRVLLHNDNRNPFLEGYLFGFLHNVVALYWISYNSGVSSSIAFISFLVTVFYLSIFWGLFSLLLYRISKKYYFRALLAPFIIVLIEYARSLGPLGFPWMNLALTQTKFLNLIQFIDITGSYGLSFLIIISNIVIYNSYKQKKIIYNGILPLLFIIISLIFVGKHKIQLQSSIQNKLKIAIVQPNIDPLNKWKDKKIVFNTMDSLLLESVKLKPNLILFPETAFPSYLRLDNKLRSYLQNLVDSTNIPILTGTLDILVDNGTKKYFNSSMWLTPRNKYVMQSKIKLVPFAEYDLFPKLFWHPLKLLNINLNTGSFYPGSDYIVFRYKKLSFSNLICYESSFPHMYYKLLKNKPDFITIQTNEGWLGNSIGPYQHFEIAKLRAIENRVFIIRSANTGISGIINNNGFILDKIALNEKGILFGNISINKPGSFYSNYGDVFSYFCILIFILLYIYQWEKKRLYS